MANTRVREYKPLAERKRETKSHYPESFICPITKSLFVEPVVLSTGYSVEKSAALELKHCPYTNAELKPFFRIQEDGKWVRTHYVKNYDLKDLIEAYKTKLKEIEDKTHMTSSLHADLSKLKQLHSLTKQEIEKTERACSELSAELNIAESFFPKMRAIKTTTTEQKNATNEKKIGEHMIQDDFFIVQCPITKTNFTEPSVILSSGRSYDRKAFNIYMQEKKGPLTCPITGIIIEPANSRSTIDSIAVDNLTLQKASKECEDQTKQFQEILFSSQKEIDSLHKEVTIKQEQLEQQRQELMLLKMEKMTWENMLLNKRQSAIIQQLSSRLNLLETKGMTSSSSSSSLWAKTNNGSELDLPSAIGQPPKRCC